MKYPGKRWANNTLIDEGNEGLRAEVHYYQCLMDKVEEKEQQLSTVSDKTGCEIGGSVLITVYQDTYKAVTYTARKGCFNLFQNW